MNSPKLKSFNTINHSLIYFFTKNYITSYNKWQKFASEFFFPFFSLQLLKHSINSAHCECSLCLWHFFWCRLIFSSVSVYVCVLIWQPLCVCPCLRARLEHCRRSVRTHRSCWTATLWTDHSTLWFLNFYSSSSTVAPRLGTVNNVTYSSSWFSNWHLGYIFPLQLY